MEAFLFVFGVVAALGCGLIAGAFFAFSTFVMKALARRPASEGIAAMQSINVVVLNPVFLGVFLGTTALSVAAVVAAVVHWPEPAARYWLGGGVMYLLGTFLVTVACNVPRNNALAAVSPTDPAAADFWTGYVRDWTTWNHVRTAAALGAAGSFMVGLRF